MLKASQISQIINEVWDGIERSKVGPIIHKENGQFIIHNVAFDTYKMVLESVLPKNLSMNQDVTVGDKNDLRNA